MKERDHTTWLGQFKENTRQLYVIAWNNWTKYMGDKDESWTLQNLHSEDWGIHLVNFRKWLSEQPKTRGKGCLSDNSTAVFTNSIRGYLSHIGASLSLTKAQRRALIKIESQPLKDYPFNLRVKEQLMRITDPVEDYLVCAGVSFGFRIGDFLEITRGILEPLIHMQTPIQLPEIRTKKEGIKAYPFIDKDAQEAIQRLLKVMDAEGRTGRGELMLNLTKNQVNDTLKKLFEKAGISTGEFRVRFHILRKFLSDKLASVCSEDKWKHFVGKSAKSPYVSSEGQTAYSRAMEFTNVDHQRVAIPEDTEKLREKIRELEGIVKFFKNQIGDTELYGEGVSVSQAVRDLQAVVFNKGNKKKLGKGKKLFK